MTIQPEIVEYEETSDKPAFDITIGTKTMNDIGIILDFSANLMTIDSIKLPMQSINKLPVSDKEAMGFNYSLEKNQAPKNTDVATQRIVQILDAKYKKADLPEIV